MKKKGFRLNAFPGKGPMAGDTSIIKKPLSDQIYERLKSDIVHQNIAFGEKLVNREFQRKFDVSSTPIRDAINRLYQDGLVESITNSGAKVVSLEPEFVMDVSNLLSILSRGAVDQIIRTRRVEDLVQRLEAVMKRYSTIRSLDDYVQLDKEFHQSFFDCCGNQQLASVFKRYSLWTEILVRMAFYGRNDQAEQIQQHERILKNAQCGDVILLREEVTNHYEQSAEWFAAHPEVIGQRYTDEPVTL